jgi:Methyltransferase domain
MTEVGPRTRSAAFPDGHFYSPVGDPDELAAQVERLWPAQPPQILGIDFNDAMHQNILGTLFPRHIQAYDYPEYLQETPGLTEYFTGNSEFGWLDSRALFVLLREWQPKRMIEVGSGFSSLLTADVNRRFLDSSLDLTCIEPYPRAFLQKPISGINRLLREKVQEVPLTTFARLQAGDILFIDSSHVAKTGSDVNYLYFEVLPRLAAGVRVHIHDIFLPYEYKRDWVLDENRSWNEQYLVRGLLMYSTAFRVLFGCSYASSQFPELVSAAVQLPGGPVISGGSFWIERVGGTVPRVPGASR